MGSAGWPKWDEGRNIPGRRMYLEGCLDIQSTQISQEDYCNKQTTGPPKTVATIHSFMTVREPWGMSKDRLQGHLQSRLFIIKGIQLFIWRAFSVAGAFGLWGHIVDEGDPCLKGRRSARMLMNENDEGQQESQREKWPLRCQSAGHKKSSLPKFGNCLQLF